MNMNWNEHRRPDGSIDLLAAYMKRYGPSHTDATVIQNLAEIESLQPIQSRQLAALALVSAREVYHQWHRD